MQQERIKYWVDGLDFTSINDVASFLAHVFDADTPLDEAVTLDSVFDFDEHEIYFGEFLDEASELNATQKQELQNFYKKAIDIINEERRDYYRDYYPQKTLRGSNPDYEEK